MINGDENGSGVDTAIIDSDNDVWKCKQFGKTCLSLTNDNSTFC